MKNPIWSNHSQRLDYIHQTSYYCTDRELSGGDVDRRWRLPSMIVVGARRLAVLQLLRRLAVMLILVLSAPLLYYRCCCPISYHFGALWAFDCGFGDYYH